MRKKTIKFHRILLIWMSFFFISSIVLNTGMFMPKVHAESTFTKTYGDVNDEGTIDSDDAMTVLQYYAGLIPAKNIDLDTSDVNGDNNTDSDDAMLILQYYAGLINKFPVENLTVRKVKLRPITEKDWLPIPTDYPYELMEGKERVSEDIIQMINQHYQQVYDAVIAAGVRDGMDEMTAFYKLRDWLCANCAYDYTYEHSEWDDILEYQTATCNGYMSFFQLMCYMCGIKCYRQQGHTDTGGFHGWNYLQLNYKWYYADITWYDINKKYDISTTLYEGRTIEDQFATNRSSRYYSDIKKEQIEVNYHSNNSPNHTTIYPSVISFYKDGTYVKLDECTFVAPENTAFAYWAFDRDGMEYAGRPGEWTYLETGKKTTLYAIYQ